MGNSDQATDQHQAGGTTDKQLKKIKVINSPTMLTTYRRRGQVRTPGGTIRNFLENDEENLYDPSAVEIADLSELEFEKGNDENDRLSAAMPPNSRKNRIRQHR